MILLVKIIGLSNKLLLKDRRVDPSANNNYSIKIASSRGHTEVVRLLLEDSERPPSREGIGRADSTVDDNYPLEIACKNGYTEIVNLFLDGRIDPSLNDNHCLKQEVIQR